MMSSSKPTMITTSASRPFAFRMVFSSTVPAMVDGRGDIICTIVPMKVRRGHTSGEVAAQAEEIVRLKRGLHAPMVARETRESRPRNVEV